MYRRIICLSVIVCVVLTGCGVVNSQKSFEEVSRRLLELSSYTCDVTMRVSNNISTMEYKLKHFYRSPDKYRVVVLSPKELEGQVTIYNGSRSYIYHPGINQYLVTENFSDSIEYDAFIGSFLNHLRETDKVKVSTEKDGDKELIALEFDVFKANRYMRHGKLWIDPEKVVPVKAEIYGDDGRRYAALYYDNFVYNPQLKDGDFEITQ